MAIDPKEFERENRAVRDAFSATRECLRRYDLGLMLPEEVTTQCMRHWAKAYNITRKEVPL